MTQCAELTWHLRGWANNRLVDNTRVALQHNLSLGGAVVLNVYKRADGQANASVSDKKIARSSWLGYNPAVEARGITDIVADRVRSKENRSDFSMGDTSERVRTQAHR